MLPCVQQLRVVDYSDLHQALCPAVSNLERDTLRSTAFDCWRYTDDDYLRFVEYMFYDLGLVQDFRMNPVTLRKFVFSIRDHYNPNPFHCFAHAFAVTQMVIYVVLINSVMSDSPL
jgi:hypothetical protein